MNRVLAMVVGAVALASVPALAQPSRPQSPPAKAPDANSGPAEQFKALGKAAPLTVLPARLAGHLMPQVGDVMAMMLERAGMTNLETSRAEFTPPEGADLARTATAFAEFVHAHPTPTQNAMFVDILGTRETGISEVRAVIVNTRGEILWQDKQAKGDADYDRARPREPMECLILIANRLRPVLGLGDPTSASAPTGKIAQRFQQASGVPSDAEMKAIERRGEAFKKAAAGSTIIVYPAHAGDAFSVESAKSLAAKIVEKKYAKATAADKGPQFAIERAMNEQKVLWSMANQFSAWVKQNPPAADYVVFADYLMGKGGVGGVHFAICNKQGELVVVDFQNDHHRDFNAVKPTDRDGCDALVIKRLEGYCR